jgi:hypothetical protein
MTRMGADILNGRHGGNRNPHPPSVLSLFAPVDFLLIHPPKRGYALGAEMRG